MNTMNELQSTYNILEQIGAGGGGTVFKAYHKRLQKYVVLKKIHSNMENVLNSRMEVDILKNLRHSYLPQVIDFIEVEGGIYTVMDFIPGDSVEQILKKGIRFTQGQVTKYGRQLCEAVAYLHAQKPPIIHGDIKPANIMLTPEDNICLIDFNISGFLGDNSTQNIGYSAGYASPEQCFAVQEMIEARKVVATQPFTNQYKVSKESDLYSVGATLYHMLCGQKPHWDYNQITPLETMVPEVSDSLIFVIQKAMNYYVDKRFRKAEDMLKALSSLAKMDKRYKMLIFRQEIVSICFIIGIAASIIVSALGKERMEQEKLALYDSYIVRLDDERTIENEDKFEEIYDLSRALFSDRLEAYYQKSLFLFETQQYEDVIEYIQEEVLTREKLFVDSGIANIYFILANAHFELKDYQQASGYFRTAIKYNERNPEFYRDYAITLARLKRAEEAREILTQAEQLGLAQAQIYLVMGEIENTLGNYEAAAEYFDNCIHNTDETNLKLRAYIMWSRIYDNFPGDEEKQLLNVDLLETAKTEIPYDDRILIYEKLAQAYINLADITGNRKYDEEAIDIFEEIVERKWDTYITHNNLTILYEKLEEYQKAYEELSKMLDEYGEKYNTYKRLAYLELERQAARENADRDYHRFLEYYEKARGLYQEAGKDGAEDMEMLVLEEKLKQLRSGGWFE